jgi:probable HAF family extracellular repeat protein
MKHMPLVVPLLLLTAHGLCPRIATAQLYHLTPLGFLSGYSKSEALAINDEGEITGYGYAVFTSGNFQGFSWSNGAITAIGSATSAAQIGAYGINDAGQIVGENSVQHAFITTPGGQQDLGTLGGVYSGANGINSSGQVVGFAGYSSSTWQLQHAFLWTSSGGMKDLGSLPGYSISAATAISASGTVVGYSYSTQDLTDHAFVWSNGTMQALPSLSGQSGCAATAINSAGVAVGYSELAEGDNQYNDEAVLWTGNGTVQDLGHLPGTLSSIAYDINDLGEVVGSSNDAGGIPFHAFLWSSGDGMQDLASVLDSSGNGWTLIEAAAINNEGQIVGYGRNPGNYNEAFLLTPAPEPSTLALLAAGAIGLLAFAWWRRAVRTAKPAAFDQ